MIEKITKETEGRIDTIGLVSEERKAFFEFLDKLRKMGHLFFDLRFSSGPEFIVNITINLDKGTWTNSYYPKAEVFIREEKRR